MDYYTVISRDNNALINMLLDEVNNNSIKSLNNWDDCYHFGIDGILVNMVYNIIKDDCIYKKIDIDTRLNVLLKPVYKKTSNLSDKQFYDIFNNIWNCIFQINTLEYRYIKTLALNNQPTWRKIINTNKFMIISSILLLVVSAIIGGKVSFISLLFMIYLGTIIIENYGIVKTYTAVFITSTIVSFFISFLSPGIIITDINKCVLISFMLSLLMIPLYIINKERLKETDSENKKYRKMKIVK